MDIQGSLDVRASATAKACVAAFAGELLRICLRIDDFLFILNYLNLDEQYFIIIACNLFKNDRFIAFYDIYLYIYNVICISYLKILASEGHAHPRVVELPKTNEGLGFNVMGGKEQNSPIYISRIIPGGVADRHGGLKRGDQLLSVNGVSVEGENHEKAVELLKQAVGSVKLVVRYTPKVLEEMELRFDKQRAARRRTQYQ